MSCGKISAQAAHAAVAAFERCDRETRERWLTEGQKKVVLKVKDEKSLLELKTIAEARGIAAALIQDAGLTEIPPGTTTALGLGPARTEEMDRITSISPCYEGVTLSPRAEPWHLLVCHRNRGDWGAPPREGRGFYRRGGAGRSLGRRRQVPHPQADQAELGAAAAREGDGKGPRDQPPEDLVGRHQGQERGDEPVYLHPWPGTGSGGEDHPSRCQARGGWTIRSCHRPRGAQGEPFYHPHQGLRSNRPCGAGR